MSATVTSTPAQTTRDSWRWSVIGLLVVGVIIAYVARSNISVALVVPEFRRLFQLTDASRGTLNSAFFWSYAFLQIPAGWIVDRDGVRELYAIAIYDSTVLAFIGRARPEER